MKEIELKLTLPTQQPEQLDALLDAVPALAQCERAGGRQTVALHNIYFDTPDHLLHRKRIALRLRQKGSSNQPQWLQTLKIGSSTDSALSQRGEWESPVAGAALSKELLMQTPWPGLDPQGVVFAALVPCFTTAFSRTLWRVAAADGSRVEVAFDQGVVQAGEKNSPICELELELLSGQPAALFDVALQIAATVAVLPAATSKAQRGFALAQGTLLEPCVAPRRGLKNATGQARMARAELLSAFAQITGNLNVLLQSYSPAGVQQAHIGLRRLRAALRYFKPDLPQAVTASIASLLQLSTPLQQGGAIAQSLQNPATGTDLLKICRWLELDF